MSERFGRGLGWVGVGVRQAERHNHRQRKDRGREGAQPG